MKTHIVSIGYGRQLFEPGNSERERLQVCAHETAHFHMIVFSHRSHGLSEQNVSAHFTLYPTHSASRFFMLYDAVRIGFRILKNRKKAESWCITTQDPLASGVVGYVLRLGTRVPLVIQEHGDIFSGKYWRTETISHRVWYWVARVLVRSADRVRAVSQRVARHLEAVGVQKETIVILPVFTDITKFQEKMPAQKRYDNTCTILSVARFVPQKDLLLLLRACARAMHENSAVRLMLVGTGPQKLAIETEVTSLGIGDRVTILPWSDDVPSLMHSADIYALSSTYEGWGRVLLEAMAAGLPSVTTDVGCVGEVFIDGKHGMVVPVGAEKLFGESLLLLARDPEKRAELARNGIQDSARIFSAEHGYAHTWARVYTDVRS